MRNSKVQFIVHAAMIAAIYVVLTYFISAFNLASGAIQVRISEALTILPYFTPAAIPGLAVGCVVTNLAGLGRGVNPAGAWDLLWGPLATLLAALLTWRLRNLRIARLPVLATLPPVLINAVVVGTELTLVSPQATWQVWGIQMASVGIGQAVACIAGGLILYTALDRSGAAARLFGRKTQAG